MKNSSQNIQNAKPQFELNWIPKIHEEVLFMEQTSGDFIVFRTSSIDQQFKIDGFAAILWKNIDGEKTLQDFYTMSVEMTDQDLSDLKPQILQFFDDLQHMGLLEN